MRKQKIYLDTSVISHLKQEDVPDKMNDTLRLWEEIKNGEYNVTISAVTIKEVLDCSEPKRSVMLDYLNEIIFTSIEINQEMNELANEIVNRRILTKKSLDDCTHIAAAIVSNCDIIVSWNFKHLVNIKTINGVREIVISNHYKPIDIYSPTVLIKGDGENG